MRLPGGWVSAISLALWVTLSGCEGSTPEPGFEADSTIVEAGQLPSLEGVNLDLVNFEILPGDDFYRFANGMWLDSYELPADKSSFGIFYELYELSQERVQILIEELAAAGPEMGSVEQKIGDYFASFLDQDALDEWGIEPIREELDGIASIQTHIELAQAFGRSSREASSSPFGFGVEVDRKNPARWITGISAQGTGLPDRDYYLEDSERFAGIRDQYQAHIGKMLEFDEYPNAIDLAPAVLDLETRIAEIQWPRVDRRNRDLTYNLRTVAAIEVEYPGFPWRAFFAAAGVVPEELNVHHPSTVAPLVEIINDTALETWKAYLTYHLIANNAAFLARAIDDANFDFYGRVLRGQPQQRERWRRGIGLVSGRRGLGDAIGKVYVSRYFSAESKVMMMELVENMRAALKGRIGALDWMGEETKARAFDKLEAFLPKVGYPDRWRNYDSISIERGNLMENVRRLRTFYEQDALARLSEPTDRNEWFSTAQTVNAFYNSQFNAITFPAGILEPPFFNRNADAAVNYGAIGAFIGHEMGHGFDDQGSKSDGGGVQRNWWTDADRSRFEERAGMLADQYSAYEAVPGTFIDGAFTLGENIGDLGGISIAYHAYRLNLGGEEAPVINGLTGDQRFFIAYAQVWRSKIREESLLARLKADPHSPAPYRTNGVVRNVDAWYEAFDVGKDAALYLAPEQRVSIW